MSFHDTSNTGLGLGLGLGLGFVSFHDQPESCMKSDDHPLLRESLKMIKKVAENPSKCNKTYPSLTLGPPDDDNDGDDDDEEVNNNNNDQPSSKTDESYEYLHPGQVSSHSAVSSFSNSSSIKRERDIQVLGEEFEVEIEKVPTRVDDVVDEDGNTRKKLRLTKEQAAVLEENFRDHSTLNSKQKQELAMKLNLRTRQVEVWFQNRRARTKLKQTESDCEVLKKCCDTLTEENKRLQKELHELKSMQLATTPVPLYMQIPAAATLSICPSCERICGANNNNVNSDNSNNNGSSHTTTLLIGSKAHHHPFYKSSNNYPFPHSSSAAC